MISRNNFERKKSMKKITKILIASILAMSMLFALSLPIFAASGGGTIVQPMWTSIRTASVDMSFSGTSGNATGSASKQSTATSIEGTVTVYKNVDEKWVYVADGHASKKLGMLIVSVDFTCQSGVTYKAVFDVKAYTGTLEETETFECTKMCP